MNIFIEYIYNKKRFGIIPWIKYKIFVYKLNKINPNFGMMWQIADFIKLLEQVYMYDNSSASTLYSSSYKNGLNGFVLNKPEFVIKFTLDSSDESIAIDISRTKGTKLKSSNVLTENSVINDINNEQLLINIIGWTMSSVKELLIIYYNLKDNY